jgi:hypothetical protein
MNLSRLRDFVSKKLSVKRKGQIGHFVTMCKPSNIFFLASFGAVRRTAIKIESYCFNEMQPGSRKIVEELDDLILQVESRKFWPAHPRIRFIEGMSGQSFRALLSLLFKKPNRSFLEIGTWKGSTFCSAIYGNELEATCVDDWSEFGGPSRVALRNISKRGNNMSRISIVNRDFRKVSFQDFLQRETDIYFFDGPHTEGDHFDGAFLIGNLKFRSLLFIVDDWNWDQVRQGTLRGLESLNVKIVSKKEIFTSPKKFGRFSRWHNGYAFFVLEK